MSKLTIPFHPITARFLETLTKSFVLTPGRTSFAWGWTKARKEHLAGRPECYVCGHLPSTGSNDVHHIMPRHIAPDLIGLSANLVTLCRKNNCHLVFGHFGDYRRRFNPDILRIVGPLGAKMVAARKAFDAIQLMTPEERLASLGTFQKRIQAITRKEMPALPALVDCDDSKDDILADLTALKMGRKMHHSRIKRLIARRLIARRPEIGPAAFSLTKKGDRFLKDPSKLSE